MDNKAFAKELEKRTRQFAVSVIRLSARLPKLPEANVVRQQLAKSGTSIGANYREANRARSRADFISKIKICESEASETQYWLEVIKKMSWVSDNDLKSVCDECSQLLAISTSIGKNSFAKEQGTRLTN